MVVPDCCLRADLAWLYRAHGPRGIGSCRHIAIRANEGSVIASGKVDLSVWVKVAINYPVPFIVSSIGYLAPFRRRRGA